MEKNKVKILAIDDSLDNLISVKALVREAFPDASIFTTSNGRAGLEMAQAEDPDVILLDVIMPGMDGFEVCQSLKSNPQTRDIPVVFLTALKDDKDSRIQALEVGAEAFLAKPIDEIELAAQIRAMQKISVASKQQREEKETLTDLVAKRTRELELANTATLNLLEDLKTENEIRMKSEERLRLITDNMVDLIAQFDAQAFFQYVSPSYEKILGYRADDLVGKSALDFLHPDQKDESIRAIDAMLRLGAGEIQFRFRHKDGSYRWIESTGRNLMNADGQVIGSTMGSRDITERKQAEEALQKSEARYTFIAKNATDVIWALSLGTGKYTYVSPSVQKLRGYTPDEVMNQTMAESLTPESLQKATALIQQRLAKRKPGDTSSYTSITLADQPCKDGSVVSTEAVGSMVFDENGVPVEIIGVSRDITARKQAEAEIKKQLDELQRWQKATLGREMRVLELKREVNELLGKAGQQPRYPSAEAQDER